MTDTPTPDDLLADQAPEKLRALAKRYPMGTVFLPDLMLVLADRIDELEAEIARFPDE